MPLAEWLSLKCHICPGPGRLASGRTVHFWDSVSGHYPPIYRPPGGVYLLNIPAF